VRAEDAQRWAERQVAEPTDGTQAVDRYARERADDAVGGRPRRRAG
jgi:hypothetical protein